LEKATQEDTVKASNESIIWLVREILELRVSIIQSHQQVELIHRLTKGYINLLIGLWAWYATLFWQTNHLVATLKSWRWILYIIQLIFGRESTYLSPR